jgi:predicted DNA-binding protein with PD1-like motif
MKSKLLDDTGQKTFALIFDKGDEVVAELTAFAKTEKLAAAHFTAIGAFSEVTLGYFDRASKDYRKIPVREQVEVLSLIGDIALAKDGPQVHAHVVIGAADATARGGHLLNARVWPTLEVILVESPRHLRRRHDPESGLALIDLQAAPSVRSGKEPPPQAG